MKTYHIGVGALAAFAALGAAALAQPASPNPPSPGPMAEVSLVRQDQSDCTNGNVSDSDPSRIGGTAWVSRDPNGTTTVKVAITGTPNTTYHFFLKCVRLLGDIKTYDEGEGNGAFDFRTGETGNVYAFDMYPEGAPAGNKYQSVQVVFK
jgi:hypothetical protein